MPTDAELERSLRNAVKAHYANPKDQDSSVNSFRVAAENELGLDAGFFKDGEWKNRSKEIIQDQFAKSEQEQEQEPAKETDEKPKSRKRASPVAAKNSRPRKKSKINLSDEEESTALSDPPESEDEAPKAKARKPKAPPAKSKSKPKPKPKPKVSSDEELSDAPESVHDAPQTTNAQDDDTSSELSSVIDDPQPPKKRARASNGDKKSSKPSKSKPAESDPNTEEIKRLQNWLGQCGIRKVWGKELKPFETPKAKINHLKQMLTDAGMTGRFSKEKAAQIKEARELAADIEAVQEGNERWGKDPGEGSDEEERPKRRLIRGAQNFDFLSSDAEETD